MFFGVEQITEPFNPYICHQTRLRRVDRTVSVQKEEYIVKGKITLLASPRSLERKKVAILLRAGRRKGKNFFRHLFLLLPFAKCKCTNRSVPLYTSVCRPHARGPHAKSYFNEGFMK
jgi:hypothetical protein